MNWTIANLEYALSEGDLANVITIVHWRVSKEDGDHTASSYGTESLEAPEGDFTPWADVTAEMVIGWVQAAMGEERVAELEAALDADLYAKANPTTGAGVPW